MYVKVSQLTQDKLQSRISTVQFNENNTLIAQDDDSGTGFESSISYTAVESGNYYLSVMGNIGELSQTSGSYSVESVFF